MSKTMCKLGRKAVSLLLTVSLLLGILPVTGRAINLTAGEFNPNTGLVRVDFDLQLTQEVSIEVLVDGEHFGWLLQREELTGYEGAMTAHDPCDTYDLPETFDTSHTAGVATDDEVQVCPRLLEGSTDEADVDSSQGDGYYTILWNGSIAGHPVVGVSPDSDFYELTIWVRPQGYPDLGITPCEENGEGGLIHGEDWIWTQQFAKDVSISMDYATILGAEGLEQLFIALQGGKSMEAIMEFLSGMSFNSNFVDLDSLAQNIYSNDPVNLIDGSYTFDYTDLALEGQIPLAFKRYYSSLAVGGALGRGFTHSFDYSLRNEDGFVHVALPGGEEFIFLKLRGFESADYYGVQNGLFTLTDAAAGGYDLWYKDGSALHFNADGQLVSVTNIQGITAYTLTYNGDKLTEISGLAGTMTLSYEGAHITGVTDSAGRSVVYGYDGDNLVSVTNSDDDTLYYTYDANGYLAAASDFEGEVYVENTYDGLGRVTYQEFTNAGVVTVNRFSYDDENLVNTLTDASGWWTKYYYDEYRHLLYTEDLNGRTLSDYSANIAKGLTDKEDNELAYELDENGNITKINYPDGTSTAISYNARNLVTSITYADGGSVSYTYDANGSVTAVEDQNGHSTRCEYNANGLPTAITDALGNTTSYAYDGAGRLLSVTDPVGGETRYDYDSAGRIVASHVKISASETATTRYEYSPAGKLLKVTDALGNETAYTYNANGFTTSVTDALGGVASTEYGTNGQPLKKTDANGGETVYTYNAATALLESVTDPEGNTTRYAYDERGNLIKTTDAAGNATKYEYDALDRLTKITDALSGETKYEYDCMGRVTSVTDAEGNATAYAYDAVGRTTSVTDAEGGVTAYAYDGVGNLLTVTDASGNTTATEYDAVNRAVRSIDAEGNATAYDYDAAGRLIRVTDALGGVASYTYDLAGNLLSVTDPNGGVTRRVYDLLGRTVEQINADNSSVRYAYDALGRVTSATDELGGVTAYAYDANGNRLSVTDPLGHATAYAYNKND